MAKLYTTVHKKLTIFINKLTELTGNPFLFTALVLIIIAWFGVGILFDYDDTWFDILDVFVFLTTFFLVFIVQSTQNADTKALQDKLDEIIDSLPQASDRLKGEEKEMKRDDKKST